VTVVGNNIPSQNADTKIDLSSNEETKRSNLNIYHQNICGVSNKRHEIEVYIADMEKTLHYVCLSEHFLNSTSVSSFTLSNYYLAAHNTRKNKRRGGTLILASIGRKCVDLPICNNLYMMGCFEVCGVRDGLTNTCIICLYRNPVDSQLNEFMQKLELLLAHMADKKCIICGDFNINLLVAGKKRDEFISLLNCYGFKLIFNEPTFRRNNAISSIDNIVTNISGDAILNYTIDHNNLADGHAGIFSDFFLQVTNVKESPHYILTEQRLFNKKIIINLETYYNQLIGIS
jgi:hypothetical protein